jgi:hypothetical protein
MRSVTDKGANQKTHLALTGRYIQVDKENPHISAHQSPTRIKPVVLIDSPLTTSRRPQPTPPLTPAKDGRCNRKPCAAINDVQMLQLWQPCCQKRTTGYMYLWPQEVRDLSRPTSTTGDKRTLGQDLRMKPSMNVISWRPQDWRHH